MPLSFREMEEEKRKKEMSYRELLPGLKAQYFNSGSNLKTPPKTVPAYGSSLTPAQKARQGGTQQLLPNTKAAKTVLAASSPKKTVPAYGSSLTPAQKARQGGTQLPLAKKNAKPLSVPRKTLWETAAEGLNSANSGGQSVRYQRPGGYTLPAKTKLPTIMTQAAQGIAAGYNLGSPKPVPLPAARVITAAQNLEGKSIAEIGAVNADNPFNKLNTYKRYLPSIAGGMSGDEILLYSTATDEDRAVINTFYGQYPKEIADRKTQQYWNNRSMGALDSLANEENNLFAKYAAAPVLNIMATQAGVTYGAETVGQNIKNLVTGENKPVPEESRGSQMMKLAEQSRDIFTKGMSSTGQFFADTGLSIGNNLVSRGLYGPGARFMLGAQAGAGGAYSAGQKEGTGARQLLSMGAQGIAEYLGEGFSFRGLEKIVQAGGLGGLKSIIKSIGAQMGIEFTEEAATETMNILSDLLIMQDQSDVAQYYTSYQQVHPGSAQAQAGLEVALEVLRRIGRSGAAGAVSGGLMGLGANAVSRNRPSAMGASQPLSPPIAEAVIREQGELPQTVSKALGAVQPKTLPIVENETGIQNSLDLNKEAGADTAKETTNLLLDKLRNNIPDMQGMETVTRLTGQEFPKSERKLTQQVGDFFRSLGNKVTREGFGDVILDEKGVQDSIAHGLGRSKSVTFAAVPEIIAKGRQIDYQHDWKGRGYDTYVFAGPVDVGDTRGYIATVVRRSDKNSRYYLHEVLDEKGNVLYIKKDSPSDIVKTGTREGFPGKSDGLSAFIIPDSPANGNPQPLPVWDGSAPESFAPLPIPGSRLTGPLTSPTMELPNTARGGMTYGGQQTQETAYGNDAGGTEKGVIGLCGTPVWSETPRANARGAGGIWETAGDGSQGSGQTAGTAQTGVHNPGDRDAGRLKQLQEKSWKETSDDFSQRAAREGRAIKVVEGKSEPAAYSYKEITPEQYTPHERAMAEAFAEWGVSSVILTDGPFEGNRNGVSYVQRGDGTTIGDGGVFMRRGMEFTMEDALEAAGHESMHVGQKLYPQLVQSYRDSLFNGNYDISSPDFKKFANKIEETYFAKRKFVDKETGKLRPYNVLKDFDLFEREATAYISGFLNSDPEYAYKLCKNWVYDWDSVVEEWTKAKAAMGNHRGAHGGGAGPNTVGPQPLPIPGKEQGNLYAVDPELRETTNAIHRTARKLYSEFVSNTAELERMSKIQGITNPDKATANDFVQQVRNAGGVVDYIGEKALVGRSGEALGKSWEEMFAGMSKNDLALLNTYAQNKHHISRMEYGKPVIDSTVEQAAAKITEIEQARPDIAQKAAEISEYWDIFMREWAVGGGLVSQEAYDHMREMYPDYIPTFRADKRISRGSHIGSGTRIGTAQTIKKAKGGTSEIIPLEEAFISQMNKMVRAERKNELFLNLYEFAKNHPKEAAPYGKISNPDTEAQRQFQDGFDSFVDNADFESVREVGKGIYKLTAYQDGKPVSMDVSQAVFDGLNRLLNPKSNTLIDMGRKLTGPKKALITGFNPFFAITNAIRDVQTGYVNSITNRKLFAAYSGDLLSAANEMRKNTPDWQLYQALGGKRSGFYNTEKGFTQSLVNPGLLKKSIGAVKDAASFLGENSEQVVRFAEFKNGLKQYGQTADGVRKSMQAAADVTVNFSRNGYLTKALDSWVVYLNAGVQGLDKTARQFKAHPVKTLRRSAETIGIATLLLWLLNKENPNYEDLDDRTKDNYYVIPNIFDKDENGYSSTFLKLPKSREWGAIMGAAFERALRFADGEDFDTAFDGLANTFANAYGLSNPATDYALAPLLYNLPMNKDFAGRTIVPESMRDLEPRYQYDYTTSSIARNIGDTFNVSPKMVDYLLDDSSGVIGDMILPAATGKPMTEAEKLTNIFLKPLQSKFTANPLYQNGVTDKFYNALDQTEKEVATGRFTGDVTQAQETKLKYLHSVATVISDLRKREHEINQMNIPLAERQEQTFAIRKQITEIARTAEEDAEQLAGQFSTDSLGVKEGPTNSLLDKVEEAQETGIDQTEYLTLKAALSNVEGKKDFITQKTIPGSVKEAKIKYLMSQGYNYMEALRLYEILG